MNNAVVRKAGRVRLLFFVLLALLFGAGALWFFRSGLTATEGSLRLTPVSFSDLPGWPDNDARAALAAFRRSCIALEKLPATRAMGGAGYAGVIGDWQGACSAVPSGIVNLSAARNFFETWFAPVAIGAGNDAQGLFTGYYEPELRASRTKTGAYRTPVYGLPDDLVSVDLGLFKSALHDERIAGRIDGHRLVPYANRAEIDASGLPHAQVLLYADDPIELFFLQIQGSGRARLPDGSFLRLAFAGQNGRAYTPIGRTLIAQGALARQEVSLQSIRGWLRAHPEKARAVMESDDSFVFFQETPLGDPALGSPGSEGVALTPGASLAVDSRLHPLGAPAFVAATSPDPDSTKPDQPLDRLLVAQDTGGAINGPVRGDVFWGFGTAAKAIAGRMKSPGRLFVLLPKPLAAAL
ncbi:MAG: MltA domain-containing protein, partial [Rhizomicrobium sp.]